MMSRALKLLLSIVIPFVLCLVNNTVYAALRMTRSLNKEWKFVLDDVPDAYLPDFTDEYWRVLDVPHDWAFENGYSEDGAQAANGGYASGGIGWYRKTFNLSPSECSNRIFIDFDAVYMNSEVWVNGHYLGKRPYGYISFGYEITDIAVAGENAVSVRVDNSREPSARWYHGCGIYGNVSLSFLPESHFKKWGTFVRTLECDSRKAVLNISSEPDIHTNGLPEVEYLIKDSRGNEVYRSKRLCVNTGKVCSGDIVIENPVLWDIETPVLYILSSRLFVGGKLIDEENETFGIRSVRWDGATGFWLNGRNIKLRGVCEHLEGGAVGAAWTENLMRWKVKMLKDMGCNAIRTSHNPQLSMFYDICNEMGMLVLDEIFDGWKQKASEDYGKQAFVEWWERDLRDFIRRDRNYPCVIAYSMGNETNGPVANQLVKVCHEEDPTRLVTSGHSASEVMDIFGVNGGAERKTFIENYKITDKAFIGTETPHTWQVRGYYRTNTWYRDGFSPQRGVYETPDLTEKELFHYEWASPEKWVSRKQHFNSSYDNATVRINARQNMEFLRDLPWYSASFRWTGFDYLGEAGYVHGGWPFRAFMGGVIDLAGFPKDHYYLYQSQWSSKPMVHILPHWTHPDLKRGEKVPVWVYTTGDSVELFFNGKSLGKKSKGMKWNEMQCEWMVPWKEGTLEAVAYSDGEEIARTMQSTSSAPSQLRLSVSDACLTGSPEDLHIVDIEQTDHKGTLYPYGENRVYWTVKGNGEIFSAENGSPVDVETNYHATSKKCFFGLLRLFVRNKDLKGVALYAASILGDKRLKTDNRISIDVRGIDLKGTPHDVSSLKILYTTDGSDPVVSGNKYSRAFRMKNAGIVKAVVMSGDSVYIRMEEKFGSGEGLYWGNPEEKTDLLDVQAENCKFSGGMVSDELKGYQSKGYLLLENNSDIEFYQENDGSAYEAVMVYRYVSVGTGTLNIDFFNNGKAVFKDKVTLKSGDMGKWNERRIKIPLSKGANDIKLKIKSDCKVGIDGFGFK